MMPRWIAPLRPVTAPLIAYALADENFTGLPGAPAPTLHVPENSPNG